MGVSGPLSPDLIKQIIQKEQLEERVQAADRETACAVFRYGAMVGSRIERFASLESGLDMARKRIVQAEEQGRAFASGTVIMADELSAGRGRFRRFWHAPSGGVWMTLVLANTLLPEAARLYPLAVGVACCESLAAYVPEARIKWVNDVHLHGHKLAGILIETFFGPKHGEEYVLVGIGINVNNSEFPAELNGIAASVRDILGEELDLSLFCARLLGNLAWNIGMLYHEEEHRLKLMDGTGLEAVAEHPVLKRWRQLSDTIGRRVRFGFNVQQKPEFEARVLDVDRAGSLVLQLEQDGRQLVESAGEIVYLD